MAIGAAIMASLAGCSSGSAEPAGQEANRAIVMVSGTASMTPFTTPTEGCASGMSAGNTYAYLRDALIAEGFAVYTQPVNPGPGQVPATADEASGPFDQCPAALPEGVTINSIDSPETGGERLAAFLALLNEQYGIEQVDLVAHSLGGIFVRNGIRQLQEQDIPVTVRSLTTLSSPWEPAMPANPPNEPAVACDGNAVCQAFAESMMQVPSVQAIVAALSAAEFDPWTQAQAGVLDGIPVTLVGGSYFTKPLGNPDKWPTDGIIQLSASLARSVPDSVLPIRSCFAEPATHSAFVSAQVGDAAETGINWNSTSAEIIANAVRTAGTDKQLVNRLGCPTP